MLFVVLRSTSAGALQCPVAVPEGLADHHLKAIKSLQEVDWAAGGEPWNTPTIHRLEPLANYTFGFRLFTAPSIRKRDAWLSKAGKAVAQGVPGAPPSLTARTL